MRIVFAAVLLAAGSTPAGGQADYYARVGVTGSTSLVQDVLFQDIVVRQGPAPTLTVGASLPISPRHRTGLELALASGGFERQETGLPDTRLGTLRTLTATLGLDGPIARGFRYRVAVGTLSYLPAEQDGIFRRGGPTNFLAGLGADWRRPIGARWDLVAAARYDYHRFTTDELAARGFSQAQQVHRLAVSVGLARGGRQP